MEAFAELANDQAKARRERKIADTPIYSGIYDAMQPVWTTSTTGNTSNYYAASSLNS